MRILMIPIAVPISCNMEIKVKRRLKTDISTIGEFYVGGVQHSFTLEDKDRGLKSSMPLSEIQKIKVHGKTAIPSGKYEVVINYSNRFKKYMPLLLNVPGYGGVRIHPGNTAEDTEGCILLGSQQGKNWLGNSRMAYNSFMEKLKTVEQSEKIYIIIE